MKIVKVPWPEIILMATLAMGPLFVRFQASWQIPQDPWMHS